MGDDPFAQMGLRSSDRETPTATYDELIAFRTKAAEMGLSSLATAALIGWEWLQREIDIFATQRACQHGAGCRREDEAKRLGTIVRR